MAADILVELFVHLARILAGIVLSAGALYTGIGLLDSLTQGIDEWKQIKKGNSAVALFYAAVMISIILLTGPRIMDFLYSITLCGDALLLLVKLLFALFNYLLGLGVAVLAIFLTIHIIDYLTADLEEMKELQKGNVAIALIMSVVLFSVSFMLQAPIESLFSTIKSMELFL